MICSKKLEQEIITSIKEKAVRKKKVKGIILYNPDCDQIEENKQADPDELIFAEQPTL